MATKQILVPDTDSEPEVEPEPELVAEIESEPIVEVVPEPPAAESFAEVPIEEPEAEEEATPEPPASAGLPPGWEQGGLFDEAPAAAEPEPAAEEELDEIQAAAEEQV